MYVQVFLEPTKPLHLGFHPASNSDHAYQYCALCNCGQGHVEAPEESVREIKVGKCEVSTSPCGDN